MCNVWEVRDKLQSCAVSMDSGVWVKERKTMHVCHDKALDYAVHMWVVHNCMKGTLISGSGLKEKEAENRVETDKADVGYRD
ncbi:unnamed protein product [Caretta caretta]